MISHVGARSRSVPEFAISSQGVLWGRASWYLQIDSQPTISIRLSWNSIGRYRHQSARSLGGGCFDFLSHGALKVRFLKYLNRSTAYSTHPIELKLDRMILDVSSLNPFKLDFSISFQGAQWERASCRRIFQFFPQEVLWGTSLQIFRLIYTLQFLRDWAETWQYDTRHQSAQSLGFGFSGAIFDTAFLIAVEAVSLLWCSPHVQCVSLEAYVEDFLCASCCLNVVSVVTTFSQLKSRVDWTSWTRAKYDCRSHVCKIILKGVASPWW